MSSSIFFHSVRELNWKVWSIACIVAALASSVSIMSGYSNNVRLTDSLLEKAKQSELKGNYRQARQDYDLLLLKARGSSNKKELCQALLNSSRIDAEFDELGHSTTLAREALKLSLAIYGKESKESAESMMTLANVTGDNEESIRLYKSCLATYKKLNLNYECARVLTELSACYDEKQQTGSAISACRGAMKILEHGKTNTMEYVQALASYSNIADLEPQEKSTLVHQAINIAEGILGNEHPDLSPLLLQAATNEFEYEKKIELINRAANIDEKYLGSGSLIYARDLAVLAEAKEAHGSIQEAANLRRKAQHAFLPQTSSLDSMSNDFLQSYANLLSELKFESEAARIRSIAKNKADDAAAANASYHNANALSAENADNDASCDPEYWMRTELLPIDSLKNFESQYYDNIQCWYQHGELKLEAFREGEIVWSTIFGACPTGIVNMSADRDQLKVSWRDGDGPIWHNDVYTLGKNKMLLSSSITSDAYSEQIESQLSTVLEGDADALDDGSVQSVPASYINKNFVNEAIQKGEHKALMLYGDGDIPAAAERLGLVFDFVTEAINSQRQYLPEQKLSRFEQWVEALKHQGLPTADYVTALNDYGYFLQQNNCLDESKQVFLVVTKISPERAVAYLNLGDSFWKLGKFQDARSSYRRYIDLMSEMKDEKLVPQRILKRVRSESAIKSVPTLKSQILGV